MSRYGLLGNSKIHKAQQDIRGATLYGVDDEKLGKIDDIIFDHTSGNITYIVVDTGGWLRNKEFIVPADRLRSSTKHRNDFACDLTKRQIEAFPAYHHNHLKTREKWVDYESRYRAKWDEDHVMHRRETDRNITPATQQWQGNQSSIKAAENASERVAENKIEAEAAVRASKTPTERVIPAGRDSVVISNTAVGIGPRWDTFQALLRQRRKEAVAQCSFCASAESSEDLEKAG